MRSVSVAVGVNLGGKHGRNASGSRTLLITSIGGTGAATGRRWHTGDSSRQWRHFCPRRDFAPRIHPGGRVFILPGEGRRDGPDQRARVFAQFRGAATPVAPTQPSAPSGRSHGYTCWTVARPPRSPHPARPLARRPAHCRPTSGPIAAAGTPPLSTPPPPGSAPDPLYRPEVTLYAAIPLIPRKISIQQIDTLHDCQGDGSLPTETGALPAVWGRV